ncbi:hypothetical protein N1851_007955 [Merluccius polli]|uniref:Ig-like domain-containing protein n=1 Tax=Merluccius polli TaxID=89951 RepID=A0AA47N3E1_MERPO|nr:hypothetical protein N1851_007955 [Merluccius polli]
MDLLYRVAEVHISSVFFSGTVIRQRREKPQSYTAPSKNTPEFEPAAAAGFKYLNLCLGNDDWRVTYTSSNVCILRGSTVEISCTYKYPKKQDGRDTTVQKTLWFTKRDGDNMLICEVMQTMQIVLNTAVERTAVPGTAVMENFQFITNQPGGKYTGDPGVTLSVTDLECHSMCGLSWSLHLDQERTVCQRRKDLQGYIGSEDIFSWCSFKDTNISPLLQCTPSVTVRPSGEIEEGSSVTLSCSSDANPADNTDDSSRYLNQGQQLVFDRIMSSDSGKYLCEARMSSDKICLHLH